MKAQKLTKETIRSVGIEDKGFPEFFVGDTITVSQRIREGEKERIQVFEGDVIAIKQRGVASTFTVRKIGAHGIAVERIFPYYSPLVKAVAVVRSGDVRRAKLYYIRERVGKSARVKELIKRKDESAKEATAQQ
jgi:large subunit ribosomal protein L19